MNPSKLQVLRDERHVLGALVVPVREAVQKAAAADGLQQLDLGAVQVAG
jgi:hypothetical protein